MAVRILFDTETCNRCSGSGRMPYSAYQGVCFKCHGRGKVYTRTGANRHSEWQAFRALTMKVPVCDLKVGDRFFPSPTSGLRTLREPVRDDLLNHGLVVLVFAKDSWHVASDSAVTRRTTVDDIKAFAGTLGRKTGWTVIDDSAIVPEHHLNHVEAQ